MAKILIAYGTTEGQTRKIAEYMAQVARAKGHKVIIADGTQISKAIFRYGFDAFIVGSSVHHDKHHAAIKHFVQDNFVALQRAPSAFFSVSLTAAFANEEYQAEARQYVKEFIEQTSWQPDITATFGGALRYTEYDFFKRMLVKFIVTRQVGGGAVDATNDYEYTDWDAVTRFVGEFHQQLTTDDKVYISAEQ